MSGPPLLAGELSKVQGHSWRSVSTHLLPSSLHAEYPDDVSCDNVQARRFGGELWVRVIWSPEPEDFDTWRLGTKGWISIKRKSPAKPAAVCGTASRRHLTWNEINGLIDPRCGVAANLAHLSHVFEGYASDPLDSNPYSPGSARAVSWDQGRNLAKEST